MLRPLVSLLAFASLSMAFVACTGEAGEGTPAPIVPTAELTLTASPEPTDAPVSTEEPEEARRTGDAELDAIIEAVESRDIAALAPLVVTPTVECTTAQGLGGPPKCEPGMTEGEPVEMFPYASCEGAWTRFGVQTVAQFALEADGLWAVARVDQYWNTTDGWEVPDTFLFFHSLRGEAGDAGQYLEIADGRIVRANWICAGGLQGILDAEPLDLEVTAGPWDEPVESEPVEAPSTGVEAIDEVLAMVARYDFIALSQSAGEAADDLPDFACEEPPLQGPGGVECDPKNGETEGDLVSVFPLAYCEGALVRDPADSMRGFLNDVPALYSVVEAPSEPSQSELYPHGAYWLVYDLQNAPEGLGETGARLHVTAEGNVTALWYGCLSTPEELVEWDGQPLPEIEVREE